MRLVPTPAGGGFLETGISGIRQENLVLVEVDFPRAKQLTAEVRKQNANLPSEYRDRGIPDDCDLNGDGKQVGLLGYMPGGPEAFIRELERFRRASLPANSPDQLTLAPSKAFCSASASSRRVNGFGSAPRNP